MSIAATEAIRRQAWFLAALIIVVDQAVKWFVRTAVVPSELIKVTVLPIFNLVNYHNPGVGFGMMANGLLGNKQALIFMTLIITLVVAWWLLNAWRLRPALAYGAIIGGGISNAIDRIMSGSVFDFLEFHFGERYFPAFNLADCAVVLGVAVLLWDTFTNKQTLTPPSPDDD